MDQRRNPNPDLKYHPRKTTRLKGYDYSQPGYYFVTICTQRRLSILGKVIEGQVCLSEMGRVVAEERNRLPHVYPNVCLDEFIVMPDHIHGIIQITETDQHPGRGGLINPPLRPPHGLIEIVRGFKTWSARYANRLTNTPGVRFWQRSFYDHIIRDELDLDNIRIYIQNNPLKL